MDSYTTIVRTLTEDFGIEAEQLRPDATFESLELDSLALVELGLIVHERTGQQLEDVAATSTLGEAAQALDALRQGKAAPSSAPPAPPGPELATSVDADPRR